MLSAVAQAIAGDLLALVVYALRRTSSFTVAGQEEALALTRSGKPLVLVGWHGDDLVGLAAFRKVYPRRPAAVISRSDARGRIVQRFARRAGVRTVPLGTDPRSTEWARAIVRFSALVRAGWLGLIAVDGPEGPAHQVKPGAAMIAQRSGALIVPTAVATRRAFRLWRWDRHIIPLPGSRVVVFTGAPLAPILGADGRLDSDATGAAIARGIDAAEASARALL